MGITKPQKFSLQIFFSFSPKSWMINSTHGVFGRVFKIWGLILKFWKASVLACDQQINRSEPLAVGKVFQNMRINPHFLKNFFFFFCKESALYIHAYELKCELLLVLVMMTFSEWVADWSGMVKIWNCTVEKATKRISCYSKKSQL